MRRFFLLALLTVGCAAATGGIIKAPKDTGLKLRRRPRSIDLTSAHVLINENRLKVDVVPTGYKLEIHPYPASDVFVGHINIKVKFVVDANEITLHADDKLEIMRVAPLSLIGKQAEVKISKLTREPKRHFYLIELADVVPGGTQGQLEIHFQGHFANDSTDGLFKTSYINSDGQESYIMATNFRPNNARKVFPCFDEPSFKVPFEFNIRRTTTTHVLSNSPLIKTEKIPAEPFGVMDEFQRTPKLSTFSLGFIISDLKELENETLKISDDMGNNLDIRIWARDEVAPLLAGIKNKIAKLFKEISEFWQFPLPITKIDIVAMPNYKGVKAMDSWGLIIFKEGDLASNGYYQLAQELHYQWAGIMSSPAWWSDIHLNKALVGFLSAVTAQEMDRASELDGKWPMTILYSLYYESSKRYPHSRITGMKQETTSSKIELLFRMFNYTMGRNCFRSALRNFIKDKAFTTFTARDMWETLTKAAAEEKLITPNLSYADIANSWITKNRLPLVSVERNYSSGTASISQKVYLRERPHDVPGQDRMVWWIPLVIVPQEKLEFINFKPTLWLSTRVPVELTNTSPADKFIILNPEEVGPFPVNYDTRNWNLLATFLSSECRCQIPVNTRAKLLHDAWNLAYAGELNFATAFNMTLFLKEERHHLVWDPVFTMIDHIGRHIDSSSVHKKFEEYVRTLLTPLYEELLLETNKEDDPRKLNLISLSRTFLCKSGYKPCIQEAQAVFKKWTDADEPDEGNPVPNQYICPVFKWGTKEEWEFGLQRIMNFPSTRKPNERTYLLKTLAGCPISQWKIKKLLELTIVEENGNFTENDIYLIFSMLTGGSRGYSTLFNFLIENWDLIKTRFENKTNLWHNIIASSTSMFTTQEGLDKVTKLYIDKHGEFGSAEHIVQKSLKNIREETKWSEENLPVIEEWVDSYLTSFAKDDDIHTKFVKINVGD